MRAILLLLILAHCGCAASSSAPAPSSVEQDCARALDALKAEHDAGTACETARGRILLAFPTCPLRFVCRPVDAGAEAGGDR